MTELTHDILVVDDEEDIRMLIAGVLKDEGYSTREAGNSEAALREVHQRRPSLVILDIWLQGSELDGLEILNVLREEYQEIPVIMISGHGNVETAVAAISAALMTISKNRSRPIVFCILPNGRSKPPGCAGKIWICGGAPVAMSKWWETHQPCARCVPRSPGLRRPAAGC